MPKVWLLSLKVRFIVGSVILHFEGKVQWCGKLILIYQNFEINLKYPYLKVVKFAYLEFVFSQLLGIRSDSFPPTETLHPLSHECLQISNLFAKLDLNKIFFDLPGKI